MRREYRMSKFKKIISALLGVVMCVPMVVSSVSAKNVDYTIKSPYENVVWEGENAWQACKGNLHTHSTYSDADVSLPEMVKEYYEQGYDFLTMSEHGITGRMWNEEQTKLALYQYQKLLGKEVRCLTDEEFDGITSGSYPLYDGSVRGKGMTCVPGGNEFNYITLTKCHVDGFFLDSGVGDAFYAGENAHEAAVRFIDEHGGLSHINHPGDWLETNTNPDAVNDKDNIKYFGDIIMKYDSCLGIEALNDRNSTTGYDRILWDNLLMYTLPYGKTVMGFSNSDAHDLANVDTSFSVFMMEDNTAENVKKTMQSGAFFGVTRILRSNDKIGPSESFDVRNQGLSYPMFSNIKVDGHKITVKAQNADEIQWIANGNVIFKSAVGSDEITIDLDQIEGSEDFLYVRAELLGEGGLCLSQAFVIDNGEEKPEWKEDTGFDAFKTKVVRFLKSTLLYVIIQEIVRMF